MVGSGFLQQRVTQTIGSSVTEPITAEAQRRRALEVDEHEGEPERIGRPGDRCNAEPVHGSKIVQCCGGSIASTNRWPSPVIRLRLRDQQGSTHIPTGVLLRQPTRFCAKLTAS
jgi:hypothetical protein